MLLLQETSPVPVRIAAAYRLLSPGAGTGDTVRWLIGSTSLDQGHAERAEGLGQIDAYEMSFCLSEPPWKSHVPLMLSGQRRVSLRQYKSLDCYSGATHSRRYFNLYRQALSEGT